MGCYAGVRGEKPPSKLPTLSPHLGKVLKQGGQYAFKPGSVNPPGKFSNCKIKRRSKLRRCFIRACHSPHAQKGGGFLGRPRRALPEEDRNKSGGFSSPIPRASPRGITAKKDRQPPQSMEPNGATAPHRSNVRGILQANKIMIPINRARRRERTVKFFSSNIWRVYHRPLKRRVVH